MLQAFWLDRAAIAVPAPNIDSEWKLSLCHADGEIPLHPLPTGLTESQKKQYPQLAAYAIFRLSRSANLSTLKRALKGNLFVAAVDKRATPKYSTGVQIAGVLDDLFHYSGPLGAIFHEKSISIRVWAPTARSVDLQLFLAAADPTPAAVLPMTEFNGVWNIEIDSSWSGKYYLFATAVFVPSLQKVVENIVTDPYSVDLSLNGAKTRLTNLASDTHKPPGWNESQSPRLASVGDLTIYELHMRDFSAKDPTVPPHYRGTYLAFVNPETCGMRHLRDLANAGLKAIQLLPTFHIATINEDKTTWETTPDLSSYPPDSEEQQAAVSAIQNVDAYNWGYDPVHYLAPSGAYASNPDNRVKEYRQMVQAFHRTGLRVIQDVVFNHTTASGQSAQSVLDKLVPNYYHRLDADGNVTNSSCCADTASEHRMMEKLMIDTLLTQARQYKIEGFRFDFMSFHFVNNMRNIQQALSSLTLEKDGVDGSQIYLYGEGWNKGETANNALGPNASQANMYGSGIGTFNDRMRDAIRGGGLFADPQIQGFATGAHLADEADWIRAGLAGNLRDFTFIDHTGKTVTAGQLNYHGARVGYTASPLENIAYASAHDNQTLFDAIQLKTDISETIQQRTRRQILANSLIAFSQGVPFFQAGDDLLRSKDMDENSYNSGDWFNAIDFTFQTNNWGIGLPVAAQNQSNWPMMQPLLANPALKPTAAEIDLGRRTFQEFLSIRQSSPLFRMSSLTQVQANLHFLNTGPHQIPGVIVMALNDSDSKMLVVFNATKATINFEDDLLQGFELQLHPIQSSSADEIVRRSSFDSATGTVVVPALTTAVFVSC